MTSAGSVSAPRTRVSKSCGNCRAIKRRCDHQIPQCGQCVRQGDRCQGYRDSWELIFHDQTRHTIRRTKEKMVKGTTKSAKSVAVDLPLPPARCSRALNPSVDDVGVNYFVRHFIQGGQSYSRGCLNYIPSTYDANAEHPMLLDSMAAVGLIALANSTGQNQLADKAYAKYAQAIRRVNAAIASPIESMKDTLGIRRVSEYRSWRLHVQGAVALVVARGKRQFSSPIAIHLFNQVRTDLITSCVNDEIPFPEEMLALEEEASKHTDPSSPFWLIGVFGTRCARLLNRIRKEARDTPWLELLSESTMLRHDFQNLLEILATEEPYIPVREAHGDPSIIYNGWFDRYRDAWAIRLWNHWRNLLMITCRIECYILENIIPTELAPAALEHMILRFREAMQTLSDLGDDILATIPQALDILSSKSEPRRGLCVSGGYMLAWRLAVVGQSPTTKKETRQWVIQRLRVIGNNTGISVTQRIIKSLEEMNYGLAD